MTASGTPSADNLYVGAGSVYFDRFVDGASTGFRHLGNVESLNLTTNVTSIKKNSSMEGARGLLKQITTGIETLLSMVLDEYDAKNVALALFGETSVLTQDHDTVTDEDLNDGDAIELDKWYDLGGFSIDVDSVSQGSPLTVDDDYIVDVQAGLVKILSTGAGTAAATTWSGTRPALTGRQIHANANPRIEGALRYVSATDQASGPQLRVDVWKVSIAINGDLALIGEDFGSFNLQATVEQDTTRTFGERYYRVVPLNELEASGS